MKIPVKAVLPQPVLSVICRLLRQSRFCFRSKAEAMQWLFRRQRWPICSSSARIRYD
jgi:hypothetical protein